MSDLHDLCKFPERPITSKYIDNLKYYIKNGIPATYTVEEAYNFINNIEQEPTTTTTPLHLICTHVPKDLKPNEIEIVTEMVTTLFEYGAGWCFTDINNDTPGCILIKRNLKNLPIYEEIVNAGVRAELLLRKVSEFDMEIIEDTDDLNHDEFGQYEEVKQEEIPNLVEVKEVESEELPKEVESEEQSNVVASEEQSKDDIEKNDEFKSKSTKYNPIDDDEEDAPSQNQKSYLHTKLEYSNNALLTKDRKDGVMMSWETDIMKLGSDTLFKGSFVEPEQKDFEINILNIGFGMGIIDKFIQESSPTNHYICEAHPDVIKKMKDDGWYNKKNVIILEGRWQDKLPELLSKNIFFNGIYYDTFSEHYKDMLELFDLVVGLLKPYGIFSFFNGLGADRIVIYEVYKKLLEIDLGNYGLNCKFKEFKVPKELFQKTDKKQNVNGEEEDGSIWDDVKRSYWSCPTYYHPEVKFMEF
ncbi:RMT2 [Candida pseudojiufengensis]|uniref:RMT2 n=1 Tax=Candida pseudojiufengensis TaxID=497109 RepID=UPI00222500C7|nr:RMT2 [Candida pseudojiufengensis]KAI5964185.1 RMT2 [Candida pseudojiufengensis]